MEFWWQELAVIFTSAAGGVLQAEIESFWPRNLAALICYVAAGNMLGAWC